MLPAESCDLIFNADVYHHFEFPDRTLESIFTALKPGGRLAVLDFERIPGDSSEWTLGHVRAGKATCGRRSRPPGSTSSTNWTCRDWRTTTCIVFGKPVAGLALRNDSRHGRQNGRRGESDRETTGFGRPAFAAVTAASMVGAGGLDDQRLLAGGAGHAGAGAAGRWVVGGLIALCGAAAYGGLVRRCAAAGGEYLFLARASIRWRGFWRGGSPCGGLHRSRGVGGGGLRAIPPAVAAGGGGREPRRSIGAAPCCCAGPYTPERGRRDADANGLGRRETGPAGGVLGFAVVQFAPRPVRGRAADSRRPPAERPGRLGIRSTRGRSSWCGFP